MDKKIDINHIAKLSRLEQSGESKKLGIKIIDVTEFENMVK